MESPTSFDYETNRRKYANGIPLPQDFSFPTHVLDKFASTDPTLNALHYVSHDFKTERKITYSELSSLTKKCAILLKEEVGIRKGDRVLVQIGRRVEWWIVVFGLMRLGAVPIPGTMLLVGKDLQYRAEVSKAVAFIGEADACSSFESVASSVGVSRIVHVKSDGEPSSLLKGRIDFADLLDKVSDDAVKRWQPTPLRLEDTVMIYFTSGTTGLAKMVLQNAECTVAHVTTGLWYRMSKGKTLLNLGDLGWAKGSYATFGAMNVGGCVFVLPPPPGAFDPIHLIEALHRYPIDSLCCPPTAYRGLLTAASRAHLQKNPPKQLAFCVCAGEPINASVIADWKRAVGLEINDGWGQTETCIIVGNYEGFPIRQGSMGKPSPGFEIDVLGPEGPVEDEVEGELCIRTNAGAGRRWLFKGYLKASGEIDKREVTFNGKTWYLTGDRGRRDRDGYFWFIGRADDVITSAGYRIGPFEVESALKSHDAVLESAAVASPHETRGEIVKAFVIPSAEYEDRAFGSEKEVKELVAELQKHCREVTAAYKYPREMEFVKTLPKTVSGKILRVELRNQEYAKKGKGPGKAKL